MKSEVPYAAPRFSWTSCYVGVSLGGGIARKDMTDPVQLVQDSFIFPGATTGVTTASTSPTGAVIGGQIGCDYEFASSRGPYMKNSRPQASETPSCTEAAARIRCSASLAVP